jgi:hypothetical protein
MAPRDASVDDLRVVYRQVVAYLDGSLYEHKSRYTVPSSFGRKTCRRGRTIALIQRWQKSRRRGAIGPTYDPRYRDPFRVWQFFLDPCRSRRRSASCPFSFGAVASAPQVDAVQSFRTYLSVLRRSQSARHRLASAGVPRCRVGNRTPDEQQHDQSVFASVNYRGRASHHLDEIEGKVPEECELHLSSFSQLLFCFEHDPGPRQATHRTLPDRLTGAEI